MLLAEVNSPLTPDRVAASQADVRIGRAAATTGGRRALRRAPSKAGSTPKAKMVTAKSCSWGQESGRFRVRGHRARSIFGWSSQVSETPRMARAEGTREDGLGVRRQWFPAMRQKKMEKQAERT